MKFYPNNFGEDKFLAMFGGLHIELALWNTVGDFLEDSGLIAVLTELGVLTSGRADSVLKASHLTRTRRVHQETLLALSFPLNTLSQCKQWLVISHYRYLAWVKMISNHFLNMHSMFNHGESCSFFIK